MNHKALLCALVLSACGPTIKDAADAAREKAAMVTDTKETVCKQIDAFPEGLDERVDEARSVCATSASVQAVVFAALAGDQCVVPE